jgi:hypothetical protein
MPVRPAVAIASRRRTAFRGMQKTLEAPCLTEGMTSRSGMLLALRGRSALLREVKFRARATTNKRP